MARKFTTIKLAAQNPATLPPEGMYSFRMTIVYVVEGCLCQLKVISTEVNGVNLQLC